MNIKPKNEKIVFTKIENEHAPYDNSLSFEISGTINGEKSVNSITLDGTYDFLPAQYPNHLKKSGSKLLIELTAETVNELNEKLSSNQEAKKEEVKKYNQYQALIKKMIKAHPSYEGTGSELAEASLRDIKDKAHKEIFG